MNYVLASLVAFALICYIIGKVKQIRAVSAKRQGENLNELLTELEEYVQLVSMYPDQKAYLADKAGEKLFKTFLILKKNER